MVGHADNKKQTAETRQDARTAGVDERGVKFLGMKHLKLVQVKIGKEDKTICHFSPSIGGVPKEFLFCPRLSGGARMMRPSAAHCADMLPRCARKGSRLNCRWPILVLSALI